MLRIQDEARGVLWTLFHGSSTTPRKHFGRGTRLMSMVNITYGGIEYRLHDAQNPEQARDFITEQLLKGPFWLSAEIVGEPNGRNEVELLVSPGVALTVKLF
ncbi:hypothetical protein QRX60_16965 [Amycolatopsis mongoliensis]|uniref:Uncharacterized protein n=1 Tax=Amycolatopsis mongoliensis TaxID=715475 RepID=A0A9Y2JVK0_9PSEU|nr:hypothetical protein [Amycolatopsis sp. 4-36]WIY05450.1 hypothetical protein QRX60_16965 [Amycolatopsis sp. 4-36]